MAGQRWEVRRGTLDMAELRAQATQGLLRAGEVVAVRAESTAPLDTGKLSRSRKIAADPANMRVAVGFSDPKAVAAHERLNVRLRHGKRAKFLELALAEHRGELLPSVAAAIRGLFG